MTSTMLDAALAYAARGWHVFPIHPPVYDVRADRVKPLCACDKGERCHTKPGKHPLTMWRNGDDETLRTHRATTSEAVVRAWWIKWPNANIGIATGAESGLLVVDVDKRDGGWATLGELDRTLGFNYDTLKVLTPTGGAHFYFSHPGVPVPNSAGAMGPGVDVRGDGGMVVAPPSRHANGGTYRWHFEVDPTGPREVADA